MNEDYDSELFPILMDGRKTVIGTALDMVTVQRLMRIAEENPKNKYGIICFGWQEEYYREQMPKNIEIKYFIYAAND